MGRVLSCRAFRGALLVTAACALVAACGDQKSDYAGGGRRQTSIGASDAGSGIGLSAADTGTGTGDEGNDAGSDAGMSIPSGGDTGPG